MYHHALRFTGFLVLAISISSCALFQQSQTDQDIVVAEVNGENITLHELKTNFYRSSAPVDAGGEDDLELEEFLKLYIDYKLKLASARDGGYFDNEEILSELANYENQSAVPYWLEKRVRDELLEELYQRSQYEIHASHILIQVSENATPRDTTRAYNRLIEARDKYLAGEDTFENLSMEYSSKQRGQSMGGDLGYFSAGWSVKEFEDAAFATPVDSVSMPVRSQFGYHIIKVHDKRDRVPEHNFSHIFFNSRGGQSSPQEAMEKAQEAYTYLESGLDWNEITERFSDDMQSKRNGGDIGWTDQNRFEPVFTETVFSITEPGNYTEPFESEYGVHIVRLDSIRTFKSKEAELDHLYERLRSLPRYRENQPAVLSAVKRSGNAQIHTDVQKEMEAFLEEAPQNDFLRQPWDNVSELQQKPLYSINDVNYTVADFKNWMETRLEQENTKRYRYQFVREFADQATEEQLTDITKQEFPEFAQLSKDYLNGLVVFSITEDSVWNYSGTASDALEAIYNDNPDDYWFERRYRYVRIASTADSTLHAAREKIQSGVIPDSLRNHFQGLIVRRDVINSLENFPFSEMAGLEQGEFSEIFEYRRRQTIYYLEEILEPRQMTYEEAYNKLVATYQPIREAQWIESMRSKYSVHSWPERITEYKQVN